MVSIPSALPSDSAYMVPERFTTSLVGAYFADLPNRGLTGVPNSFTKAPSLSNTRIFPAFVSAT